ncbi:hypothetical protein AB6A40_010584 [Gnathostoma spinigerum]|uniref:Uncharacterized protein n=1 Tax=Gnathostoma spinigerum TaxID=75299 RepID=A0ABD6EWL4_9BILA
MLSSKKFDRRQHGKIIRVVRSDEVDAFLNEEDKTESAADTTESAADTTESAADTTESAADTTESAADTTESAADTTESAADTTESAADTTESAADTTESAADTTESAADTTESAADTTESAADTTESAADTEQSGTNDEGIGEVAATGGGDQATGHTDPITTAPITTASTANASTASNYSKSAATVSGQPPETTVKALKEAVTSGEVSVNRSGVENTRTASPSISHVPEMFEDGVAVNVSAPTRSWRKRKKPIRLSTIEWLAITLPPLVIVIVLLCVSYRYIYKTGAEELPAEDLPVDMARASLV